MSRIAGEAVGVVVSIDLNYTWVRQIHHKLSNLQLYIPRKFYLAMFRDEYYSLLRGQYYTQVLPFLALMQHRTLSSIDPILVLYFFGLLGILSGKSHIFVSSHKN